MAAIKERMMIIKLALGKAAAQLAVLGLLALAGFCVLFTQACATGWLLELLPALAAFGGKSSTANENGKSGEVGDEQPGVASQGNVYDLYSFVFRFLTWWSSLVWCVSAYCTMTVSRLGLNTGV